MVKKAGKKSSKKNSKKEKQSTQEFLKNNKWAITAVLLFVVAFLLLGNFNFGGEANITGQPIFGGEGSVFGDGENTVSVGDGEYPFTQTGMDITKIIFFIIVILFIFSILNITGIPHIVGLQWVFAILIGYLAVGYITPEEIFAVLSTYSALGLALISAIPFIIMMLASAAILSPLKRKGKKQYVNMANISIGKIFLVKILWGFFVFFLLYKIIMGVMGVGMEGSLGTEGNTVGAIILGVTFIVSLYIFIRNRVFRKKIMDFGKEIKSHQADFEGQAAESAKNMADIEESQSFGEYRASAQG